VLTILEARGQVPGGDGPVSSQQERVARNESTTREINENIERAHQAASTPDHVRIVCECGRLECDRVLAITIAEYESVRADPRQFAVTRDHVLAEVEQVVAETDRYAVVAKRPGTPAAVAIEEDPRG
jgi:5-bromo-4-chloroindolyl phosphate hydrolysis protein